MNDERDSQLSAMFDNELPDTECELLARRLSRDEALQRQWASYSLIGAALRDEPVRAHTLAGVVRDGKGHVAERVRFALHQPEFQAPPKQAQGAGATRRFAAEWVRPLAGAGIAASVAALSIFWLRQQTAVEITASIAPRSATTIVLPGPGARTGSGEAIASAAGARSSEAESYTVPAPRAGGAAIASAQLANYVVAHSEFSGPLARRNLLAALVASESLPVASSARRTSQAAGVPPGQDARVAPAATPPAQR